MPRHDPEKCSEVRDRIDKWDKYWTMNRSLYYEWVDFVWGDQWKEDESKLFERYNKIPLVSNKLNPLRKHVIGEMMQNTPNLQVQPIKDVDVETVNVRDALVKSIMFDSHTKRIFVKSSGQALVGGYGGFHGYTDYEGDDSFDLVIKADCLDDPNRYYWALDAKHVNKIDGEYAGYRTRISRKRFRDIWGKDIEGQIGTIAIAEDSTMAFADDDSITQVDDFERETRKVNLYQLSDGSIMDEDEFKQLESVKIEGKRFKIKDGAPVTIFKKREALKSKIIHRQIAGNFVLKETEFPSKNILPVIFVDQSSYFTKQGQQITTSFFKDVKDAQKFLNYLLTQSAYLTKISRWDQFIAPRRCVSAPDTQQMWRDPSVTQGVIHYDVDPSGHKPEQLRPPEISASFLELYERTLRDIQSGTGIYNTQLGEYGNEVSGEAIKGRNRAAKNTQEWRTSLESAIATFGELINEMIPEVYDTERIVMLSMPESEAMPVTLNMPVDEYGSIIKHDMSKGKYKVRIKPGPSYEGQKEEALESLQLVLNADKSGSVFPMIADLYADNLPLDNNIEIRNRLRTMVPPEIIEAGKTGKPLPPKQPQPSPEQQMMQIKMAELQQKEEEAKRQYQVKMKDLAIKESHMQREAIETQQDITMQWEKLQVEKEEAAAHLQETLLRIEAEHKRMEIDREINQTENLVKVLMHNSKHKQKVTENRS